MAKKKRRRAPQVPRSRIRQPGLVKDKATGAAPAKAPSGGTIPTGTYRYTKADLKRIAVLGTAIFLVMFVLKFTLF